jgi:hypothetical protein
MPARSTQNWTDNYLRKTPDGWEAGLSWKVVGANSETEALDAQPEPGTLPIKRVNESHDQNGSLRCRSLTARKTGFGIYDVSADFSIPADSSGSFPATKGDALLREPPRILFRSGILSLPADRDLRNRPIVNAAGDAFDPPQQRSIRTKHLTITRYEPFYDFERLSKYEQAWNTKPMKAGRVVFPEGSMFCESIQPAEEYSSVAPDSSLPSLKMQYDFLIILDWRINANTGKREPIKFPFRTYLLNVGDRGWYYHPTRKRPERGQIFYAENGQQVNGPVPLDIQGVPLEKTYKISGTGKTDEFYDPIPNPKLADLGIEKAEFSTASAVFLAWDLVHAQDFNDLRL